MPPLPVAQTSLNNFHEHPLVRVEAAMNVHHQPYTEFICDGCNTPGSGSVDVRYCCNQCPFFDLHEVCATCPKKISTHIHPKHQMVLVWRQPTSETNHLLLAGCHVCGDEVKGLYYTCLQLEPPKKDDNSTSSCKGIVLHPICSKFPSHVQHVKDPHPLTFQRATAISCTICNEICDSWRYRCETCETNIHPECVVIPCHDSTILVDESAEPNESAKPGKQQPQQQPSPLPSSNINRNINYYPPSEIPYCVPAPFPMQQQQQYYCHQEKRPAAILPSPNSGYPPPQQPIPMHQQRPPYNNYGAYYPPSPQPPMHHPHHHHPQNFYPYYPYYPYNMYLQQPAAAAAAAANQGGGGGEGASSSKSSKKKRRMFLVVGKIVASVALTTAFGIPHIPF